MSEYEPAPVIETDAPEVVEAAPQDDGHSSAQAATEAPEASAAADEPGADQQGKTPAWAEKRFGELTAKQRAAEREAAYWRGQAEARNAPAQTQQQAQPVALPPDLAQQVGAAPNPAEFPAGEFDPAYLKASVRHELRVEQAASVAQQRQATQQRQAAEVAGRLAQIIETGQRQYTNFDDAVNSIAALRMPGLGDVVRAEIADCEKPAEVAYYLGTHPEEAAKLTQLRSPQAVARAMARIEARLDAPKPAPVPSSAPPPPRTLRGSASAPPDLASMSVDEMRKHLGLG